MHASIDPNEESTAFAALSVRNPALLDIKSWSYLDSARTDSAGTADLVVVATTQSNASLVSRRQLEALRRKADGGRRLVLAALAIAEVDEQAPDWESAWVGETASPGVDAAQIAAPERLRLLKLPRETAPSWLGNEQPSRRGHYYVRFWEPAWQERLVGNESTALDRIIAAGFDGAYLAHAETYAAWQHERPSARQDLVKLIELIADSARQRAPGFLIVLENAEELVGSRKVRNVIDAIAKDGLLYSSRGAEGTDREGQIKTSIRYLKKAQRDGLAVLAYEHVRNETEIAAARRRFEDLGFLFDFMQSD
jgi:cysteinyl-tRNA synthetase